MLIKLMSFSMCASLAILLGIANAASTELVKENKNEFIELSYEEMDTVSAGYHNRHTANANAYAYASGYRSHTSVNTYASTGYYHSSSNAGSYASSN